MKLLSALSIRALILAAISGLAGGTLMAVIMLAHTNGAAPPQQAPGISGKAAIGGPFSLVDASGKRVTEASFAGRPMLVYFGFTHCPDVCPSGLQVIAAALDKLGDKATQLSVLFITLDPARDTPTVLGDYVKSFHAGITALSGTQEDTARAAKAYRVYAQKTAIGPSGDYSVDHSSFMYLMNSKGEFVQHFPHTVAPDKLAEELTKAR